MENKNEEIASSSNISNTIDVGVQETLASIKTVDIEKSDISSTKKDNTKMETETNCENALLNQSTKDATESLADNHSTGQQVNAESEKTLAASIEENEVINNEDVGDLTINKEIPMEAENTTSKNTVKQQNSVSNAENAIQDCSSDLLIATNKPNSSANVANKSKFAAKALAQIKIEPADDNRKQLIGDKNLAESFATVVVKSEQNSRHLLGARNFVTRSSLGLLAQYDSDSDQDTNENEQAQLKDDEVVEVPIEANKDYRNKVVEIDSESESDSSSSTDSDVEYIANIRKEIEKTVDLEEEEDAEDDDDDESSGNKNKIKKAQNSMRVRGELGLEDLPPIEDLKITVPEEECIVLGKVHSIVDQLLLVSALPGSTLYDLDTVLFLDKGKKVLGEVFDVLGQVADPLYCVRFNSRKDIEERGINVGDAVYVAPKTEHTQFVVISSLMKMRGSDASWENDIEPPPRYLDYSDDEQELEARQRLRSKNRSANRNHEDDPHTASSPEKRTREEFNKINSVSSVATHEEQTQTNFLPRGGHYNRYNTCNNTAHSAQRPRFNNQRPQQQMARNTNDGSWHSNYQRPYSHQRPHMAMPPMPPMPLPMIPPYPSSQQYTHFSPPIAYPNSFAPPNYVPNPYAMRPPQLLTQAPPPPFPLQKRSTQLLTQTPPPPFPVQKRSPSPPPPGLE